MNTAKNKITFRVTNKNIRLRFAAEKEKDRSFTYVKMAEKLGLVNSLGEPQRSSAWKLCQTGKHTKHPNLTYKCPNCHTSQHDVISKWINDGSLRLNQLNT